MFKGRRLVIATKHLKEKAIAPILAKELGVFCFVDEKFDTDSLGTFTGEIERELDPISTVREKCLRAMTLNNCDLGIASEGSFGPHPSFNFLSADDELLIFIDTMNNIEIIAREVSTSTNFNAKQIHTHKALLAFAGQAGFPSHGIILRKSKDEFTDIHKGIQDLDMLTRVFDLLFSKFNSVYAETDMRAMHNPTRMKVIESATEKLIQKIKSSCPHCQMPGFAITEAKKGLPCGLCGSPTNSILTYVSVCRFCRHTIKEMYPDKRTTADPMHCDSCNP